MLQKNIVINYKINRKTSNQTLVSEANNKEKMQRKIAEPPQDFSFPLKTRFVSKRQSREGANLIQKMVDIRGETSNLLFTTLEHWNEILQDTSVVKCGNGNDNIASPDIPPRVVKKRAKPKSNKASA